MNNLDGVKLDGRYILERRAGEGGMADVYLAQDLLETRYVAVKILKPEFRENRELVRRFKNESRAISVLNHPYIVKVYDINISENIQYIVMEYIDGITLKKYMEQRGEPLTYKETLHFAEQILKALQHAHDRGVVHRDIKPQNIMLTRDGNLKVMDFGIARLARSDIHTASDQAIGSVHYISPEQAQGDGTDPRADIYSVGIMMYEMLCGQLPFQSDNAVSIAVAQISQTARPVVEVNPSVPVGLSEIVGRAMLKDPSKRYQSALEMMRDIEELKNNPSIKFEYDYLGANEHTKYINRVMKDNKSATKKAGNMKKKKKRKGILVPAIAGITLAVIIVCILLMWNMLRNSGNPLFSEYDDIDLPNFVGMQYDDVEKMLKDNPYNHLRLVEVREESDPDIPAGEVVAQNPTSSDEQQKKVKANQRIYLTVNIGIVDIKIPDVAGMTKNEAIEEILDVGLRPYAKMVVDKEVPIGKTVGTEPAAGSTVQNLPDTVVTILISSERRHYERTVPSIVGLTVDDATRVLRNSDLQLGIQTEEHDDSPEGTIIDQTPTAGSTRSIGGLVHVTVSLGPEEEKEKEPDALPDVVKKSEKDAIAALTKAGYAIEIERSYHESVENGYVVSMDLRAGTKLPPGTVVTITVSRGPDPGAEVPPEEG